MTSQKIVAAVRKGEAVLRTLVRELKPTRNADGLWAQREPTGTLAHFKDGRSYWNENGSDRWEKV